jgi:hypothetical protein
MNPKKNSQLLSRYIVWALLLSFIFLGYPDITRAQAATDQVANMQGWWVQFMNDIIWLASRIWVIPAKLAGLLMTNAFVYGTEFYLVDYLFKFWQIIRTFALYALGLYFVGSLLYAWFNPEEAKSKLATLFKNTLIAGILISMSWWLIAAAVDLSVVFTSAVGSIPTQIYEQERAKKELCFNNPLQVTIWVDKIVDPNLLSNPANHKPTARNDIKPEGDDVSWPLMFFGTSVLKFFNMVYLPEEQSKDATKALIVVFVKAVLALWLVIPMVILVVVNLIRVVCLRLWIMFAPAIVLINVFDRKISDSLNKYLSRKNILWLIMQPVAVIGMLSIWLIFIIELASIFNLCSQQPTDSSLLATPISEWVDAPIGQLWGSIGTETTLWVSLSALGDVVGGITGQLIMAIFVIILMRTLIKIWFSFSELTAKTAESITDSVQKMAGSVPLVPLPGVGAIGLSSAKTRAKWGFWMNDVSNKRITDQTNTLRKTLGLDTAVNIGELQTLAAKSDTKLEDIQGKIKSETENNIISTSQAKEITKKWLQTSSMSATNAAALNTIWLARLSRSWTDEELAQLREKWAYSDDAYKLLNRLFNRWKGRAEDMTRTRTQYGKRGK